MDIVIHTRPRFSFATAAARMLDALRSAWAARPRRIERPDPADATLLRDAGLASFAGLRDEERRFAGEAFSRYGKLD